MRHLLHCLLMSSLWPSQACVPAPKNWAGTFLWTSSYLTDSVPFLLIYQLKCHLALEGSLPVLLKGKGSQTTLREPPDIISAILFTARKTLCCLISCLLSVAVARNGPLPVWFFNKQGCYLICRVHDKTAGPLFKKWQMLSFSLWPQSFNLCFDLLFYVMFWPQGKFRPSQASRAHTGWHGVRGTHISSSDPGLVFSSGLHQGWN